VVRPAVIEGHFTAASPLSEFAPLRGNLPNRHPRQVALRKGRSLFRATLLTLGRYPQTLQLANSRTASEEEFVSELENLEIPPAEVGELSQHPSLEGGLDVIEKDRQLVTQLELVELGCQRLGSQMP